MMFFLESLNTQGRPSIIKVIHMTGKKNTNSFFVFAPNGLFAAKNYRVPLSNVYLRVPYFFGLWPKAVLQAISWCCVLHNRYYLVILIKDGQTKNKHKGWC